MKEENCKHKWKVVCVCCEIEDGDTVLECIKCGKEDFIKQEKRIV